MSKLRLLLSVLEASSDFATVHRQVFPTQLYVCMCVYYFVSDMHGMPELCDPNL